MANYSHTDTIEFFSNNFCMHYSLEYLRSTSITSRVGGCRYRCHRCRHNNNKRYTVTQHIHTHTNDKSTASC